jgi:hypothetical protein
MSTSESCPENENSTDCLLRVLLQVIDSKISNDAAQFNWGPITFAFTVPIGILATVFALFTIVQAAMSSGPGRRKSNSSTIGKWAGKTRRRWNWPDLTVVSVARTPIFRWNEIVDILKKYENDIRDQLTREPKTTEASSRGPSDVTPTAMWLRFLKHLDLDNLEIDDKKLNITAADYLPDDILAVPAYADVGFIVVMSAITGASSFRTSPQSPYPVITGEGFQFDFRQHPTLGTIGAFSKFETDSGSRRPPTIDQIMDAIRHSQGEVDIGAVSPGYSLDEVLISLSGDDEPIPDRNRFSSMNAITQVEPALTLWGLTRHKCERALCMAERLIICEDEHHLLWLLLAKTPKHVPAIFPCARSRVPNVLTSLALNGVLWSTAREKLVNQETPDVFRKDGTDTIYPSSSGMFPQRVDDKDCEYVSQFLLPKEQWHLGENKLNTFFDLDYWESENCFAIFGPVFQACLKLLHAFEDFQTWFNSMYPLRQQYFRILVLLQLRQVDKWLEEQNHSGWVSCRILSLYYTTLALLDVEKAIADNIFGVFPSSDNQHSSWLSLKGDGPPKDITIRHFGTLQTLGAFFERLPNSSNSEDWVRFIDNDEHDLYTPKIRCILRNQLDLQSIFSDDFCVEVEVLSSVRKTLDSCYETLWAYKTGYDLPSQHRDEPKDSPIESPATKVAEEPIVESREGTDEMRKDKPVQETNEKSAEKPEDDREVNDKENSPVKEDMTSEKQEAIDNVLIWKCILISLSFWTAPDSSDMLSSGVWEHVVPMI